MNTRSMFFGDRLRGIGRRALVATVIAACALLAVTANAAADTTFGGNPNPPAPPEGGSTEGSCGYVSCTLYWTGPGGTDLAPIPASGGSGTVTSVTLPAMPAPGEMQAVVLTSSVTATGDPAHPDSACCQVKEVSAPFTVPPNAVTTVPLSLHVSATAAADLSQRGDTSTADGVGISVLTPDASVPAHLTENQADAMLFWAPALTAPTTSFVASAGTEHAYELSASFTFSETAGGKVPTAGPTGPTPTGTPGPAAKGGVKIRGHVFRPGADGRTLILGTAKNPPTAKTKQTLTLPGKGKKPPVIGTGKTTVAAGKSAPMKLTLNSRGRARLTKGTLKAALTVVATNPQGESGTLKRAVTLKPRQRPGHRG